MSLHLFYNVKERQKPAPTPSLPFERIRPVPFRCHRNRTSYPVRRCGDTHLGERSGVVKPLLYILAKKVERTPFPAIVGASAAAFMLWLALARRGGEF